MNNIWLNQYFKLREFECPCCQRVMLDSAVLDKLYVMRVVFNNPIIVTSGYRCLFHNERVNGDTSSAHMRGAAADITIAGVNPQIVAETARQAGFKNVYFNTAKNFTHCGL